VEGIVTIDKHSSQSTSKDQKSSKGLKKLKGIILAGGSGTRLHPVTRGVSKQLLPVYNKPMIYFPISSLMWSGIRDILIITTPDEQYLFQKLLGDGSWLGMNFQYAVQPSPDGLAQSFLIGKEFIACERVALALGDNIFYGHGLPEKLNSASRFEEGAVIFGYDVNDPERYGVVSFDKNGKAIEIVEKPTKPKSNCAITGLYFYDNDVVAIAESLKPSPRGELEISDVNQIYLKKEQLKIERLGRGVAWFDTGTFDSLLQASVFVQSIEQRQGLMIACLEEIAYRLGYISKEEVLELAEKLSKNGYGSYLRKIVE
jgi:glucose-1-phosphate thymidylyltransferase